MTSLHALLDSLHRHSNDGACELCRDPRESERAETRDVRGEPVSRPRVGAHIHRLIWGIECQFREESSKYP